MEEFTIESLAKYKVGQTVYKVCLAPKDISTKDKEEEPWMKDHHPKVYFDRKICLLSKFTPIRPPLTDEQSFEAIVYILTSKLTYSKFKVSRVRKCTDTGEFRYKHKDSKEWMPESCLFEFRADAAKECKRIKSMLTKWIGDEL